MIFFSENALRRGGRKTKVRFCKVLDLQNFAERRRDRIEFIRMIIVTGSYPPEACGVGDYTRKLYASLNDIGGPAELFHRKRWRLRDVVPFVRQLSQFGDSVVNLQYPTEGYGYSLVPQLISLLLRDKKIVLTLHEFTRKSLKGRLASGLFFLGVDWIIFTTEEERDAVCALAPWFRHRSSVIRVGSSIPMQDPLAPDADLVYFGLLRPGKGIETFAEVVSLLLGKRPLKVRVIGQMVAGYEDYAKSLLKNFAPDTTEVLVNQHENTVAQKLSRTKIALLPFPDGISFRRTSAFAAMGNGSLLVTTPPTHNKQLWNSVCVSRCEVAGLAQIVADALDNPTKYEPTRTAGFKLARELDWPSIAREYLKVAEALDRRRS